MYDHIGLRVRDLAASSEFYRRTLAALGHVPAAAGDDHAGFGPPDAPALWLHASAAGGSGVHVAFRAPDRAAERQFHQQGLAAGARDNGAPGPRPDYGANYYAAFLIDLDGNNIEAVCLADA